MQIFLDTTDVAVLRDFQATGLVDGVPTNPSPIAKSGRPIPQGIAEIRDAGADCATIPPSTFDAMFKHPLTDKGLEAFMKDWAGTGQSIL